MDWDRLDGCRNLGISAGASAPEELVEAFLAACRDRFSVTMEDVPVRPENVRFNLPRILVA